MGRPTKEFQAFDSAMKRLLTVPKAAVVERVAAHDVLPPCGDQQAAIRHIFEAKATANRGVAIKAVV